jgi:hypothetical protein
MKFSLIALLVAAASGAQVESAVEGPPCVYLDETQAELDNQIDLFSKTLDPRHWTNVLNIAGAMKAKSGVAPPLKVHTWELLDNAFTFPRIRRYAYVQENMDMLEHFEDNLNTNISNSVNMANFIKVAGTVKKNLNAKYHNGEFADPAAGAYAAPDDTPPRVWTGSEWGHM